MVSLHVLSGINPNIGTPKAGSESLLVLRICAWGLERAEGVQTICMF